jgi:hypothetical protein
VATLSEIVDKVRRKVADFKETAKYSDTYYLDAIEFALSKLSHDFDATYTSVSDVPSYREFMLIKLATIEMCYVRASEYVDSDSTDISGNAIFSTIKVPDLEIEGEAASADEAAETWLMLAHKLQAEYDGELRHSGGMANAADIQTAHLKRISLTTGGYRKYALDRGPAAVTLSAVVTGTSVALSWSTLYDETFCAYEVWRDTDSSMANEERIAYIVDNHTVTYTDASRPAATYYYRVKTVNLNRLKTNSNLLSVVVT